LPVKEAPRRTRFQLTFAVVLVSASAYALLQSLVVPVLPTLERSLHTSQNTVTWVLTAYLLAASIATPIAGRVGDMIGKKRVLFATLVLLAVGSVLAALATSIGVMIVARAIQGVGGGVLPLSFGLIRDEAPREKVASSISIVAALSAVGGGAGIVLAGPIVGALDFHWLFWIPAIVVSMAAVATLLFVPESTSRPGGQLAVIPALLLSGSLVALILAVSEGQGWGWASGKTIGLIAGGIALGVLWVRLELRVTQPLIDMRMMRLPAVWTTNLVALLFGAGLYSALGFLPEFLQTPASAGYGFGASATASGLFLLPMTVTMFVFGMLSAPAAARIGSKMVLLLGSLAAVPPFAILAFAHHQRWEIYLASALIGVGLGLAFAAMSNLIVESVPATQVGVASGMNANIRTIGGSIGAAVMAAIVTSGAARSGFPKDTGYRNGFGFLMITAILATLACLIIPSARRSERSVIADAHVVEHAESGFVAGAGLVDVE
jgi:EmrB/QacA subfamily drug resistance transporter